MAMANTNSDNRFCDVSASNSALSTDDCLNDIEHLHFRYNVKMENPTDLSVVWSKLVGAVSNPSDNCVASEGFNTMDIQAFADVLNKQYEKESPFHKALFAALKACLSRQNLIEVHENAKANPDRDMAKDATDNANEPIVFNYRLLDEDTADADVMFAIGIARQQNGEFCSSCQRDNTTSRALASDHCSCLLVKPKLGDHQWKVLKCFSSVALKIGNDSDRFVVDVNRGYVEWLDVISGKGAISHALMYTWEWMLVSHAEIEEPKDMSWAAIIGKKATKKASETDIEAVSKVAENTDSSSEARETNIEAGDADDESYVANELRTKQSYPAVKGKTKEGTLRELIESDNMLARKLIREYDVNLEHGKSNVECVKADMVLEAEPSEETPSNKFRWVSGKLFVPEKCGDLFKYSATSCGNLEDEDDDDVSVKNTISVYLETLLFGLLAAKKMLDAIKDNARVGPFRSSGKIVKFADVALTVELRGRPKIGEQVYKEDLKDKDDQWTISQGEIYAGKLNFHQLKQDLEAQTVFATPTVVFKEDDKEVSVVVKVSSLSVHKYLNHPDKAWLALVYINNFYLQSKGQKWDLFNVLFGANKLSSALITVMADLSDDYGELSPQRDNLTFSVLWSAFQDLVLRILLPLADLSIIHPDIRPGWDFTSNILYLKNGKTDGKPAMQLIDFDSLVMSSDWIPPTNQNNSSSFKYIYHNPSWGPYTFLWRQCVTVAYAWKYQKSQREMENVDVEDLFNGRNDWAAKLGTYFCDLAKGTNIRQNVFQKLLEQLSATLVD